MTIGSISSSGSPVQARDICKLVVIILQSTPPVRPNLPTRDFIIKQNNYNVIRGLARTFRISLRGEY